MYNVEIERKSVVDHNLDLAVLEITKYSVLNTPKSISDILLELAKSVQNSLFGCEVDLGITIDASNKQLEFFGKSAYKRVILRGDSGAFNALDSKEIVVEVDNAQTVMVFVPLVGSSTSHGVLEIHGLRPSDEYPLSSYHRNSEHIRSMITARDYSFTKNTRLWKKVKLQTFAGFQQQNSYLSVCGIIDKVVTTKNGVPFYGGARFNIAWEDGVVDEEVTINDLLNAYKETPSSLGVYTKLDSNLTNRLLQIGHLLGNLVEKRKLDQYILELREKISHTQMNLVGMVEMALQSLYSVIHGVREVFLIGSKSATATQETSDYTEFKQLTHFSFIKSKSMTDTFKFTPFDLVDRIINKSEMLRGKLLLEEDAKSTEWIGLELEAPPDFQWGKSSEFKRFFFLLHKTYGLTNKFSEFDINVVERLIYEIESSIKSIWARERRKRLLREYVKVAENQLFELRDIDTVDEICFEFLNNIPSELLKGHVYIGLLGKGASSIHYTAAAGGSKMEGKVLNRGEGISFDVIDSNCTVVLRDDDLDKKHLLKVGSEVNVMYGKKAYIGVIRKICGHEKFEVQYTLDKKVETGVDITRIAPITKAFMAKKFGEVKLPFVAVPVRHGSKVIGILGVDHIDTHLLEEKTKAISDDFQTFIEQLGRLLGSAIDSKLQKSALQSVFSVSKNPYAEVGDLLHAVFDGIFRANCFVVGMIATRYDIDPSHGNANVKGSIGNYDPCTVLEQQGNLPQVVLNKVLKFNHTKYGRKSILKSGDRSILLFFYVKINITDVNSLLFLVTIHCMSPVQDVDFDFFDKIQKAAYTLFKSIISKKANAEIRFEVMEQIRKACSDFSIQYHPTLPYFPKNNQIADALMTVGNTYNRVCQLISSCFPTANMYVGLLGAFCSEIHYVLASAKSQMVGKRLYRKEAKGVSFIAIDEGKPSMIMASSQLAYKLRHFAEKQKFEYPFVVTPIIAHIDALIGVLAADACADQQFVDNDEQIRDAIAFYSTVALYLGKIIRLYRHYQAKKQLFDISMRAASYDEGMKQIKSLLHHYVPSARRLVELSFGLNTATTTLNNGNNNIIEEGLVVCLSLTDIIILFDELVYQHQSKHKNDSKTHDKRIFRFKVLYVDKVLLDLDCSNFVNVHASTYNRHQQHVNPILIDIPSQSKYDEVNLYLRLYISNGVDQFKEIASKSLSLSYFLHAPVAVHKHIIFATNHGLGPYFQAHCKVAEVKVISKTMPATACIGYHLNGIEIVSAEASNKVPNFEGSTRSQHRKSTLDPSVREIQFSFTWNSSEVGIVKNISPHKSLTINDMDLFLQTSGDLSSPMLLSIDISFNDKFGGAKFQCSLSLSAQELYELNNSKLKKMPLKLLPSSEFQNYRNTGKSDLFAGELYVVLQGNNLFANTITSRIMYDLLNLPNPQIKDSSTLQHTNKRISFINDSEDNVEICEISILNIRDLNILENISDYTNVREYNLSVTILFDGVEVGSTSIIYDALNIDSTSTRSANKVIGWPDEKFRIHISSSNDIQNSLLLLEIYHHDEHNGTSLLLGHVDVQKYYLSALLSTSTERHVWYDVEYSHQHTLDNNSVNTYNLLYDLTNQFRTIDDNHLLTSQMKVGGRRIKRLQRLHNIQDASEKGYLMFEVRKFIFCQEFLDYISKTNLKPNSSANDEITIDDLHLEVFFNDRPIMIVNLSAGNVPQAQSFYVTRQEEIVFHEHSNSIMYVRYPCTKTLFQSNVVMKLIAKKVGKKSKHEIASATVQGSDAVKLMGQPGLITRLIKMQLFDGTTLLADCESIFPCVEVCVGKKDGEHIKEYDDFILALDVIAATEIPFHLIDSSNKRLGINKANTYCKVYWNERSVGRTELVPDSNNPIFNQQRFLLAIPLGKHNKVERLAECDLQIEVYVAYMINDYAADSPDNKTNNRQISTNKLRGTYTSDTCVGSICISGDEFILLDVIDKKIMQWFSVIASGLRRIHSSASDTVQYDLELIHNKKYYDEGDSPMKFKLQILPYINEGSMNDIITKPSRFAFERNGDDLVLVLRGIENLFHIDPYYKANVYAEIFYCEHKIAITATVSDTLSPQFNHEEILLPSYLLEDFVEENKEDALQLLVWNCSNNKSREFLGQITLSSKKLVSIINDNPGFNRPIDKVHTYQLDKMNDFTEEENQYVQGELSFSISVMDYSNKIHPHVMTETVYLWVRQIVGLPDVINSTGNNKDSRPSAFIKICRSYERESARDVEIFKSLIVPSNHDPVFEEEFIRIEVPLVGSSQGSSTWQGFSIKIEVYHNDESLLLASYSFNQDELKELLLRKGKDVFDNRQYLMINELNVEGHNASNGITLKASGFYSSELERVKQELRSGNQRVVVELHQDKEHNFSDEENTDNNEGHDEEERNEEDDVPSITDDRFDEIDDADTHIDKIFTMSESQCLEIKFLTIHGIGDVVSKIKGSFKGIFEIYWNSRLMNAFDAHKIIDISEEYRPSDTVINLLDQLFVLQKEEPDIIQRSTFQLKFILLQPLNNKTATNKSTKNNSTKLRSFLFGATASNGELASALSDYRTVGILEKSFVGGSLVELFNQSLQSGSVSIKLHDSGSDSNSFELAMKIRVIPNIAKLLVNQTTPIGENIDYDNYNNFSGKDLSLITIGILAAADLAKVNLLSNSDPFVVVSYCGLKVLETSVVQDSLDPIFRKHDGNCPSCMIKYPTKYDLSHKRREQKFDEVDIDGNKVYNEVDYIELEDITLTIEVYSSNPKAGKQHTFLGGVYLTGKTLQTFLGDCISENKEVLLQPKSVSQDKKLVKGKIYLQLSRYQSLSKTSIESHNLIEQEQGYDEFITVNLEVVDIVGFKYDTSYKFMYVVVIWNCCVVARSDFKSIGSQLSTIQCPINLATDMPLGENILVVEVWTTKTQGNYNEKKVLLVGTVTLTGKELEELISAGLSDNDNKKYIFALTAAGCLPKKVQHNEIQGQMQLQCTKRNPNDDTSSLNNHEKPTTSHNIKVFVHSLRNLAVLGSEDVDTYVVCKLNYSEVGRTAVSKPQLLREETTSAQDESNDIALTFELDHVVDTDIVTFELSRKTVNQNHKSISKRQSSKAFDTEDNNTDTNELCHSSIDIAIHTLKALFDQGKYGKDIQPDVLDLGISKVDLENNISNEATSTLYELSLQRATQEDKMTTAVNINNVKLLFSIEDVSDSNSQAKRLLSMLDNRSLDEGFIHTALFEMNDLKIQWQELTTNTLQSSTDSKRVDDKKASYPILELSISDVTLIPLLPFDYGKINERILFKVFIYWDNCLAYISELISISDLTFFNAHLTEQVGIYLNLLPRTSNGSQKTLRIEFRSVGSDHNKESEIGGEDSNLFGVVSLPYYLILRYYHGQFLLPIVLQQDNNMVGLWKGVINIKIRVIFSQFESIVPILPTVFKRCIHVVKGSNLPLINGILPTTKCQLMINDIVVGKSLVESNNANPDYKKLSIELFVDLTKPVEVKIVVIYIHPRTRREAIIGEEIIPFEYLLKPPTSSTDGGIVELFLGPSSQRSTDLKYTLSGSCLVVVDGTNNIEDCLKPFSYSTVRDHTTGRDSCKLIYNVKGIYRQKLNMITNNSYMNQLVQKMEKLNKIISENKITLLTMKEANNSNTSQSDNKSQFDHEMDFSEYYKIIMKDHYNIDEWTPSAYVQNNLSTVVSLATPQNIFLEPNYLVLPLADVGVVLGGNSSSKYHSKLIGLKPDRKLVFALERGPVNADKTTNMNHNSTSDTTMLQDIADDISSALVTLRWKDIHLSMRELSYQLFESKIASIRQFYQDLHSAKRGDQNNNTYGLTAEVMCKHLVHMFLKILFHIFVGVNIKVITLDDDFSHYLCEEILYQDNLKQDEDIKPQKSEVLLRSCSKYSLSSDYGHEINYFGKMEYANNNKPFIYQEVKHIDQQSKPVLLVNSVNASKASFNFPRVVLPLTTQDVNDTLIVIDNFHLYNRGIAPVQRQNYGGKKDEEDDLQIFQQYNNGLFNDNVQEISHFLTQCSSLLGEQLYFYREDSILRSFEEYFSMYYSDTSKVHLQLLHSCHQLLKGYKQLEVINIQPDAFHLTSNADIKPSGITSNRSSKVVFSGIKCFINKKYNHTNYTYDDNKSHQTNNTISTYFKETISNVKTLSTFKKLFQSNKGVNEELVDESSSHITTKINNSSHDGEYDVEDVDLLANKNSESDLNAKHFLLTIKYDNVELVQVLHFDSSQNSWAAVKEVDFAMKYNRNFKVGIIEVNDNLQVINESSGDFMLLTDETHHDEGNSVHFSKSGHIKSILRPMNATNNTFFDLMMSYTYEEELESELQNNPSRPSSGGQGEYIEQISLLDVKQLVINVQSAKSLRLSSANKISALCEVLFNDKVVQSTPVAKSTSDEVIWNHTVNISLEDKGAGTADNSTVTLDVYDMSFIRKGNFLGRCQLSHEMLLSIINSKNEVNRLELPLTKRNDMDLKKQSYVGGSIIVVVNYERDAQEDLDDDTVGEDINVVKSDVARIGKQRLSQLGKSTMGLFSNKKAFENKVTASNTAHVMNHLNQRKGFIRKHKDILIASINTINLMERPTLQIKVHQPTKSANGPTALVNDCHLLVYFGETADIVRQNSLGCQLITFDNTRKYSTVSLPLNDFSSSKSKTNDTLTERKHLADIIKSMNVIKIELHGNHEIHSSKVSGTSNGVARTLIGEVVIHSDEYLVYKNNSFAMILNVNNKVTQDSNFVQTNFSLSLDFALVDSQLADDESLANLEDSQHSISQSQPIDLNSLYRRYENNQSSILYAHMLLLLRLVRIVNVPQTRVRRMTAAISGTNYEVMVKYEGQVLLQCNKPLTGNSVVFNNDSNCDTTEILLPYYLNNSAVQATDNVSGIVVELYQKDSLAMVGMKTITSNQGTEGIGNSSMVLIGYIHIPYYMLIHRSTQREVQLPFNITNAGFQDSNNGQSGTNKMTLIFNYSSQKSMPSIIMNPLQMFFQKNDVNKSIDNEDKNMHLVYNPTVEKQVHDRKNVQLHSNQDNTRSKDYSLRPFERRDYIVEEHYGQLINAFRKAEKTVLKTSTADAFSLPLFTKDDYIKHCARSNNISSMKRNVEVTPHFYSKYLLCKYESSQIPKRHIQSLTKLQGILFKGIDVLRMRKEKISNIQSIKSTFHTLKQQTNYSVDDVILQGVMEIEVALNTSVKFLLLDENDLKMYQLQSSTSILSNDKLSNNGAVHGADKKGNYNLASEILQKLAKIIRYGIAVIYSKGQCRLVNTRWFSNQSHNIDDIDCESRDILPIQFPSFEQLRHHIRFLEGVDYFDSDYNFVEELNQLYRQSDGFFLLPLKLSGQGATIGALLIRQINRNLPEVQCEYLLRKMDQSATESSSSNYFTAVKTKSNGLVPELISEVVQVSINFADLLLSNKLQNIYRMIRSFPIKEDTNMLLVIRYIFRMIVTAIPVIRGISLWMLEISENNNEKREKIKDDSSTAINNQNNASVKTSEPFNNKSADTSMKTTTSQQVISNKSILSRIFRSTPSASKDDNVSTPVDTANSWELPTLISAVKSTKKVGSVMIGCFGSEDPAHLLKTPLERKLQSNSAVIEQASNNASNNAGRKAAILHGDIEALQQAQWKVKPLLSIGDKAGALRRGQPAFMSRPRPNISSRTHEQQIEEVDEDDVDDEVSKDAAADSNEIIHDENVEKPSQLNSSKIVDSSTTSGKARSISPWQRASRLSYLLGGKQNNAEGLKQNNSGNVADNSARLTADIKDSLDILSTLSKEVEYCVDELKENVFQVLSGHYLSRLASNSKDNNIIFNILKNDIFQNQLPFSGSQTFAPLSRNQSSNSFQAKDKLQGSNVPRAPLPVRANSSKLDVVRNRLMFFIAVNSHGIGGETGWGVLDDSIKEPLSTIANLLETNILRFHEMDK